MIARRSRTERSGATPKTIRAVRKTLCAIEDARSLDALEVIRRGLVVELVDLIEAEGLCYARAQQLGAKPKPGAWLLGQPIVGDSA